MEKKENSEVKENIIVNDKVALNCLIWLSHNICSGISINYSQKVKEFFSSIEIETRNVSGISLLAMSCLEAMSKSENENVNGVHIFNYNEIFDGLLMYLVEKEDFIKENKLTTSFMRLSMNVVSSLLNKNDTYINRIHELEVQPLKDSQRKINPK